MKRILDIGTERVNREINYTLVAILLLNKQILRKKYSKNRYKTPKTKTIIFMIIMIIIIVIIIIIIPLYLMQYDTYAL